LESLTCEEKEASLREEKGDLKYKGKREGRVWVSLTNNREMQTREGSGHMQKEDRETNWKEKRRTIVVRKHIRNKS